VVQARKLRDGTTYEKGCEVLDGYFEATVKKAHKDGTFDLTFKGDKTKAKGVPKSYVKTFVCDPILNDAGRPKHRMGVSGSCVSERVAKMTSEALEKDDPALKAAMKSSGVDADKMASLVARKYADALVAPGEAVGSIAAQSVGEPSTQMTLNTFHLAGHGGANVTLGIPRVREIIMTASRALKTPLMSIPFVPNMSEQKMNREARSFTRLRLQELLHHAGGVTVNEAIRQGMGEWKRSYEIVLHLQPEERIKEAFGLSYDRIAERVGNAFLSRVGALMKAELSRARMHDGETGETGIDIPVGGVSKTLKKGPPKKGGDDEENNDLNAEERKMAADAKKKRDKKRQKDEEEYDNEEVNEEDGVMGARFGHRDEMATYDEGGKEDDDEEEEETGNARQDEKEQAFEGEEALFAGVTINRRNGTLILDAIEVDVSTRPLLMTDLAMKATESVIIKSKPDLETGMVVEQEGRGKCLQTEGVNFEELWQLGDDVVDHKRITSNDIWGIRCAYGVEAARQSIVNEIRGVFGVYGIDVDARHLMLIADYMTHDGDYKPMNRRGMMDGSSAFLKMSFETTATFMTAAAQMGEKETLKSPSANIVLGNPVKQGTGAMDLIYHLPEDQQ
jgi:DNA-directed RNA polymerase I subunit RPA1